MCFSLSYDMHGLSGEEALLGGQLTSAVAVTHCKDNLFLALFCHVAQKLEAEWPSPLPAQKPLQFTGFLLLPEPTTRKSLFPLFLDLVKELTSSWNKFLAIRALLPVTRRIK